MNATPRTALVLTDGKAGHENQSMAFARMLGCEPHLVPVRFKSPLCKALSYPLDRLGIRSNSLFEFVPQPALANAPLPGPSRPAVVLGAGSGTFYAAKVLARRLGVRCGVVLYPSGYHLGSFGCVMAPSFDSPAHLPNVVEIPANLVANDPSFYAAGVATFRKRHVQRNPAAAAVIVGGPNACSTLEPDWMKARLDEIFARRDRELWVTTSRRTPPAVEAVVDSYPWDYKLIYSRDRFNPIPAFVSLAQTLYVTAESTGMLSEACTFGAAEVQALDNLKPGPHKFRRFLEGLVREGHVGGAKKIDLSRQIARARTLLGLED